MQDFGPNMTHSCLDESFVRHAGQMLCPLILVILMMRIQSLLIPLISIERMIF